jgi:hypothetical protein
VGVARQCTVHCAFDNAPPNGHWSRLLNTVERVTGMPRESWINLPAGPVRDFFGSINDLWAGAGEPSGRSIAAGLRAHHVVITQGTVNNLLNGPRLPLWDNAGAVIRYLGGDVDEFLRLWVRARRSQRRTLGGPVSTAPTFALPPPGRSTEPGLSAAAVSADLRTLRRVGIMGIGVRPFDGAPASGARGRWQPRLTALRAGMDLPPEDRGHPAHLVVARVIEEAVGELDLESRTVARIVFGLDPAHQHRRLLDRYSAAAEALGLSVRTIRRRADWITEEIAERIIRDHGRRNRAEVSR